MEAGDARPGKDSSAAEHAALAGLQRPPGCALVALALPQPWCGGRRPALASSYARYAEPHDRKRHRRVLGGAIRPPLHWPSSPGIVTSIDQGAAVASNEVVSFPGAQPRHVRGGVDPSVAAASPPRNAGVLSVQPLAAVLCLLRHRHRGAPLLARVGAAPDDGRQGRRAVTFAVCHERDARRARVRACAGRRCVRTLANAAAPTSRGSFTCCT